MDESPLQVNLLMQITFRPLVTVAMPTYSLHFLLIVFGISASNPAHETCVAYESSYHIDKACQCLVFESNGRSHGYFSSANFPRPYPPNLNCILYTFIGDLDEIVEVTFSDFDLQVPLNNRCADFVRLYLDLERPEVSDLAPATYELCGNGSSSPRRQFYSSKRSLVVEFHADSMAANNSGFRAEYSFLDKEQFEMTSASKRWGALCSYDFYSNRNSKRGSLFSPRYPQTYPANSRCLYAFHGQADERVRLTFRSFQLTSKDKSCLLAGDVVVVHDGPDTSGHVLAQHCGNGRHGPVISTREQLSVEFQSDEQDEGQGFAATYEFLPKSQLPPARDSYVASNKAGDSPVVFADLPGPVTTPGSTDCEQEYHGQTRRNGTFSSPFYPSSYPPFSVCRFIFRSRGRDRSLVIFSDFDLHYPIGNHKEPHTCDDVDNIVVSVVISGGHRRNISAFCGSKRPPMLMSSGSRMEVIFTSGPASSARGFRAEYYFVSNFGIATGEQDFGTTCRFIYRSSKTSNGSFTSPNFPGLYPRNVDCHYVFYGREHERVFIRFQYFDVDGVPPSCLPDTNSDYVELSNYDVSVLDPKVTQICGHKGDHYWRPPIVSDGSFYRVTFRSNDVHDATGFEAFYQFKRNEDKYMAGKRVRGSLSASNFNWRTISLHLFATSTLTTMSLESIHLL